MTTNISWLSVIRVDKIDKNNRTNSLIYPGQILYLAGDKIFNFASPNSCYFVFIYHNP